MLSILAGMLMHEVNEGLTHYMSRSYSTHSNGSRNERPQSHHPRHVTRCNDAFESLASTSNHSGRRSMDG